MRLDHLLSKETYIKEIFIVYFSMYFIKGTLILVFATFGGIAQFG